MQKRKICLVKHRLIYPEIQAEFIAKQRVIAGHFRWGELSCVRCLVVYTVPGEL